MDGYLEKPISPSGLTTLLAALEHVPFLRNRDAL
jgi:hypothetical protein